MLPHRSTHCAGPSDSPYASGRSSRLGTYVWRSVDSGVVTREKSFHISRHDLCSRVSTEWIPRGLRGIPDGPIALGPPNQCRDHSGDASCGTLRARASLRRAGCPARGRGMALGDGGGTGVGAAVPPPAMTGNGRLRGERSWERSGGELPCGARDCHNGTTELLPAAREHHVTQNSPRHRGSSGAR